MNRRLRIGIAGAGQRGIVHAQAFAAHGAEIVGILDSSSERAKSLAQTFGAAAVGSVEQLLGMGLDGLSICLPHSLHFDIAMKAVEKRVPLLLEKPHCVTLEESRALRAACARRGVVAMVGFTHRFFASSQKLKAVISSGGFGRIDMAVDRLIAGSLEPPAPRWYRERALAGGGIAMIGMIHSIDRLRWLLDSEIISVSALTRQSDASCDVESTALAILEFANGTQASLVGHRSSVAGHERAHHYEIFGEHLNAYCSVVSFAHQKLQFVGAVDASCETVTDDQPFNTEIREFMSALASGKIAGPDLVDAEIALGGVLAIYESARTRRPISMRKFLENPSI